MTQRSYDEFYNAEYRRLYLGVGEPEEAFFTKQYRSGELCYHFLKQNNALPEKASPVVLEVGCAADGILAYFRDKGCRVKGIDLGAEYLEFGRSRHDLDLSVGTLSDVFLDEHPDVIIYSHVLEHILDPNAELESIRRTLSDSGVLLVRVPSVKNLRAYKDDLMRYLQNAHTYHFSLATRSALMVNNGFELIAGNELCTCAFGMANTAGPAGAANDYDAVMRYLRQMARLAEPPLLQFRGLYRLSRRTARKMLEHLRLIKAR